MRTVRPPPKLTVSEWADQHRRLSSESAAEPGRWHTARAPFQRGIMDALNDPTVEEVVVMKSAQVGASEIILNAIAYFSDQDPAPILCLQPTLEMAESFSKDRIAPMIRDTPALTEIYPDPKSRDGENGLRYKKFPGGYLSLAGANSPASLASRPIRVVVADEIDRFPTSAGKEGDPLSLAYKRANNFWNRVKLCVSTPTEAGFSRIEGRFGLSDQRYYLVPCPHCQVPHRLLWDNVKFERDDDGRLQGRAFMACPECGGVIEERHKEKMVAAGDWVPAGEFTGIAGFHISELYSPWVTWTEMARAFLASKDNPERLKTWVNTSLGEVWHEDEEAADPDAIGNRREPYEDPPEGVLLLTAGVDVQDDRLEYEIVGWGEGFESWGLRYGVITGDPGRSEIWERLADQVLDITLEREDGVRLSVIGAAIDSGGHYTSQVYAFAKRYIGRVFAVKGMAGPREIASRPRRNNKARIPLFTIGVDTIKELLFFSRLRVRAPGPGYCHFPASYDDEFFRQLTNERAVTRYKGGQEVRAWRATGRNEALDCRVYATAAAYILNPNFRAIASRQAPPDDDGRSAPPAKKKVSRRGGGGRKRGGFVTNW